jgi:hypothetical protein
MAWRQRPRNDQAFAVSSTRRCRPINTTLSGLHFQVGLLGWFEGRRPFVPGFRALQPNVAGNTRGRKQQRPERDEKNDHEPAHGTDSHKDTRGPVRNRPDGSRRGTLRPPFTPPIPRARASTRAARRGRGGFRPRRQVPGTQGFGSHEVHAAAIRARAVDRRLF